jgi:hypothetical protein
MIHETKALVGEYRSSGLTQKEFCSRKQIAVSALQYHLSKLKKRKGTNGDKSRSSCPGRFIPLQFGHTGSPATTVVIVRGSFDRGEVAELVRTVAE